MDQFQDRPHGSDPVTRPDRVANTDGVALHAGEFITKSERPAGGYARSQQRLHWIVALLVLGQLAGGI